MMNKKYFLFFFITCLTTNIIKTTTSIIEAIYPETVNINYEIENKKYTIYITKNDFRKNNAKLFYVNHKNNILICTTKNSLMKTLENTAIPAIFESLKDKNIKSAFKLQCGEINNIYVPLYKNDLKNILSVTFTEKNLNPSFFSFLINNICSDLNNDNLFILVAIPIMIALACSRMYNSKTEKI